MKKVLFFTLIMIFINMPESKEVFDYIKCNSKCKTCDGNLETDCTSCENNLMEVPWGDGGFSCQEKCPTDSGYFFKDGKCLLCDSSKCETCTGASEYDCLTCKKPLIQFSNMDITGNSTVCLEKCPLSHYLANNKCNKCPPNCIVCNNDQTCILCEYSFFKGDKYCRSKTFNWGSIIIFSSFVLFLILIIIGFVGWRYKKKMIIMPTTNNVVLPTNNNAHDQLLS